MKILSTNPFVQLCKCKHTRGMHFVTSARSCAKCGCTEFRSSKRTSTAKAI